MPSNEKIHKAIKQQLGYVHRNLKHIENLGINSLHTLSNKEHRDLLVIQKLYRQQSIMSKEERSSIDDRIVSIS